MSLSEPSAATDLPSGARNRLVLVVYTAAIFVSALLLFSVQPLFTKMVLPRLGGSPAVWSVAMVFFQSLLLGGYAYAHYLMQIRNRVVPVAVHGTGQALPKHGLVLRQRMRARVEVLEPIDPARFSSVEDLRDTTRGVIARALGP